MSSQDKPQPAEHEHPPLDQKQLIIRIALGTALSMVLIFVVYLLIDSYFYVSTDDAFIEGHVTSQSAKISNQVAKVYIDDNYEVKEGDLLVQIDPRDYEVALLEAQANYDKAQSDYNRVTGLIRISAVSQSDLDADKANLGVMNSRLQAAKLNLDYTRITAPVSGRITRKNVEPGDYVQVGQTLFSIVQHDVWVVANFKETQLTHMRPGQKAYIQIDAFPGRTFHGHVDSIQSGTGAAFSLLPPENATGNYVKVVQRVPVKIVFDEPPDVEAMLAPGMSVVPEVQVR